MRALTRLEMRSLRAGDNPPTSCEDGCLENSDCSTGQKCENMTCPQDETQCYYICVPAGGATGGICHA